MNRSLLCSFGFAVALATSACEPPVTGSRQVMAATQAVNWREPVSLADHPQAALDDANTMIRSLVRMAQPVGWTFHEPTLKDAKGTLFFIEDSGSKTVSGVVRYTHFTFDVSGRKLAQAYAEKAMSDFEDREIRKTEIDGKEVYLVQGTVMNDGHQRLSALIMIDNRNLLDITLITDPHYLDRHIDTAYAIVNSYQLTPPGISARRRTGTFSFRCEDGMFSWMDDSRDRYAVSGFSVYGKLSEGSAIIGVRQVKSTRFIDFFKKDRIMTREFPTEISLAGRRYPARAAGIGGPGEDHVETAAFFEHEGKDYMLEVFRSIKGRRDLDPTTVLNDEGIHHALDTYFYIDGAPRPQPSSVGPSPLTAL